MTSDKKIETERRDALTHQIITRVNSYLTMKGNKTPSAIDQFILDNVSKSLRKVSLSLLEKLADEHGGTLADLLREGDVIESVLLERLMYPSKSHYHSHALSDIRNALGVGNLTTVPEDQRAGVAAALRIWIEAREHFLHQSIKIDPELLKLIMSDPDREQDIIKYAKERRTNIGRINVAHLRDYLSETRPLAAGVL